MNTLHKRRLGFAVTLAGTLGMYASLGTIAKRGYDKNNGTISTIEYNSTENSAAALFGGSIAAIAAGICLQYKNREVV